MCGDDITGPEVFTTDWRLSHAKGYVAFSTVS